MILINTSLLKPCINNHTSKHTVRSHTHTGKCRRAWLETLHIHMHKRQISILTHATLQQLILPQSNTRAQLTLHSINTFTVLTGLSIRSGMLLNSTTCWLWGRSPRARLQGKDGWGRVEATKSPLDLLVLGFLWDAISCSAEPVDFCSSNWAKWTCPY